MNQDLDALPLPEPATNGIDRLYSVAHIRAAQQKGKK